MFDRFDLPVRASRILQLGIIVLILAALIVLRHVVGAFGFSLGYLYVGVIALAGFWFGIGGGVAAACVAAGILLVEIFSFRSLVARDIALNGIYLRFAGYLAAGIMLGALSQARERRMAKIEKLDEQKNIFMGIASHDLRNPLSSIALSSYALLRDMENKQLAPQKVKVALEGIHGASERMLELINDLLDITAIEAGRLELKIALCNYVALVRRNAEFNLIIAQQRDVAIDVRIESEIPEMEIDAAKIDQVLNNLVGNAIKFAPAGSAVTISIRASDGEVTTRVADRGPGVSPEDLPHIFDTFYRAEPAGGPGVKQKSTGLGLAIAKRIVEAHGGRIWAESAPGRGAVFSFILTCR